MTQTLVRPPFDPELEAALTVLHEQLPATFTPDLIPVLRETSFTDPEAVRARMTALGLSRRDVTIAGYRGDDITVTVIAKEGHTGHGPGIYHTHGGGMVIGGRMDGVEGFFSAIDRHDAVLVSVEYRLAPEFPDPYPVEDCYAGLVWTAAHAHELGIDASRILIGGGSAGGGLSAGTALLARDRQGPGLIGQLLMCPMLDDRDATVSTRQIDGIGVWDRTSNVTGWTALLGDRKGTDDVSIYAAPARAADLSGLPSAYIDCGSAEVFRDEDVLYATKLWEAGVQAELHVWAGGFHGFEMVPHAAVSRAAVAARETWIDRILGS
ncbi:alpha/beta hydrolase [Microbacterium sp. HD4P20]|uniref:alpha/beta hydrolase fold domain-containing protein n=1 Tax=Microbacterium sp. HD4P20 TaxID=2864874 RepID=UPI001C63BD63|nr:alpha/beta hydrolase [Microbacterium sp. HD4P20]MCP2637408.1 alpha/beta hydrolase [Microbacterium sp. HD4P20]